MKKIKFHMLFTVLLALMFSGVAPAVEPVGSDDNNTEQSCSWLLALCVPPDKRVHLTVESEITAEKR
jgi:hypothetical protein